LNNNWLNPFHHAYICENLFIHSKTVKHTTYGIIQSQHLVMEVVVVQCDILNLSRYQLQIKIPPSHSTVVPKFIRMWTIDSSLVDQNQQIYKI
jgi:hypothetical protein